MSFEEEPEATGCDCIEFRPFAPATDDTIAAPNPATLPCACGHDLSLHIKTFGARLRCSWNTETTIRNGLPASLGESE